MEALPFIFCGFSLLLLGYVIGHHRGWGEGFWDGLIYRGDDEDD